MAIDSVTSSTATQALLPQPRPDVAKQADSAVQTKQPEAEKPAEPPPQPSVNGQGQTVGGFVNTVA